MSTGEIINAVNNCNEALLTSVEPIAETHQGYELIGIAVAIASLRVTEAIESLVEARRIATEHKEQVALAHQSIESAKQAVDGAGLEDSDNSDVAGVPPTLAKLLGGTGIMNDLLDVNGQHLQGQIQALQAVNTELKDPVATCELGMPHCENFIAMTVYTMAINETYIRHLGGDPG